MTKRIAGLTGWASAFSIGVFLVFAILVSPWSFSFSELRFDSLYKETVSSAELISRSQEEKQISEAENAAEQAESTVLAIPSRLELDPSKISGLNKAAFSSSLYGASAEVETTKKASTLTSLVLADHLPARDLGTFSISYQVTPEEYEMLLYCVEFETRSGSVEHKALIAQVIMNRVQGNRFPFTVAEVLMAPGQFDVMPNYESRGDWTPSDRTYKAVDLVLSGTCPDYAQGALYFCNPYIVGEGNWFDTSLQTVCELEGHRFYKPY